MVLCEFHGDFPGYGQALDETSFTLQSSLSGAVIKDQLFGGLWLHLKFNSWSWISSFPDLPRTSNQRLQAQPVCEHRGIYLHQYTGESHRSWFKWLRDQGLVIELVLEKSFLPDTNFLPVWCPPTAVQYPAPRAPLKRRPQEITSTRCDFNNQALTMQKRDNVHLYDFSLFNYAPRPVKVLKRKSFATWWLC